MFIIAFILLFLTDRAVASMDSIYVTNPQLYYNCKDVSLQYTVHSVPYKFKASYKAIYNDGKLKLFKDSAEVNIIDSTDKPYRVLRDTIEINEIIRRLNELRPYEYSYIQKQGNRINEDMRSIYWNNPKCLVIPYIHYIDGEKQILKVETQIKALFQIH